ncbi:MAG: septum formation initiator [Actinobacteria bacterium]|nr:MAG: septum formation initiator [Actinomycetota bacterium]
MDGKTSASPRPRGSRREPMRPSRGTHPARKGHSASAPSSPRTSTRSSSPATKRKKTREEKTGAAPQKKKKTSSVSQSSISIGGLDISVRLLGIIILAGLLAAMLLPTVYQWWRQEQDYQDITVRVEAARERNAEMQRELDLWNDPAYVASQAHERLGYVKPGETQYSVVDPGPEFDDQSAVSAASPQGPARPWVQAFSALLAEADTPQQ